MTVLFIAGLCSLGLPGLSGFVAEITVFIGSWEHEDVFHRIATIAACMSIVVTAVYILRATSQVAMGPLKSNGNGSPLLRRGAGGEADAKWNEKMAAAILIIGIVIIGTMPFWLNDLIRPAAEIIMNKIAGK